MRPRRSIPSAVERRRVGGWWEAMSSWRQTERPYSSLTGPAMPSPRHPATPPHLLLASYSVVGALVGEAPASRG